MACFNPLDAWQRAPGAPLTIYKRHQAVPPAITGRNLKLPCNKCIGCKLEHSRQWSVRLMHEKQQHEASCFVTLTIAPEHLLVSDGCRPHSVWTNPKSVRDLPTQLTAAPNALEGANIATVNCMDSSLTRTGRVPYAPRTRATPSMALPDRRRWGDSLSIIEHQLFVKRLRKHLKQPIRFFMCGEYGDQLGRPHYHYIIFGHDFPDKYLWANRNGNNTYRSASLEKLWPYGHAEIGEVTPETCAYVARYVTKKITGNKADEHYKRTAPDGTDYWIQPEFNAMSRRPGIGHSWFQKFAKDVYPHDHVVINGIQMKPPRYYDKLLALVDEGTLTTMKDARAAGINHSDQTPARLAVRETVARARLAFKQRNLERK